jgi:hypothetical protein
MEEFQEAKFHSKSNICNWCGSKKISRVRSCLISDVKHIIYECSECEKRTSKKRWSGEYIWRPALKIKRENGTTKHIVDGEK